eukprot:138910-Pyramimonas_sp.AAC.1
MFRSFSRERRKQSKLKRAPKRTAKRRAQEDEGRPQENTMRRPRNVREGCRQSPRENLSTPGLEEAMRGRGA